MKYCLEVRIFNHNRNAEETLHFKGVALHEAEARYDAWRDKQGKHCSIISIRYLENGKPVGG